MWLLRQKIFFFSFFFFLFFLNLGTPHQGGNILALGTSYSEFRVSELVHLSPGKSEQAVYVCPHTIFQDSATHHASPNLVILTLTPNVDRGKQTCAALYL